MRKKRPRIGSAQWLCAGLQRCALLTKDHQLRRQRAQIAGQLVDIGQVCRLTPTCVLCQRCDGGNGLFLTLGNYANETSIAHDRPHAWHRLDVRAVECLEGGAI